MNSRHTHGPNNNVSHKGDERETLEAPIMEYGSFAEATEGVAMGVGPPGPGQEPHNPITPAIQVQCVQNKWAGVQSSSAGEWTSPFFDYAI